MECRCVCIFRIRKLVHHADELSDTARPTVGHDERSGVGARGPAVQKVDSQTVNRRAELADLVEPGFERPPVVLGTPVIQDIGEIGEGHTLIPSAGIRRGGVNRLGFRQPRGRYAGAEIIQLRVRCMGPEVVYLVGVHQFSNCREPSKTVLEPPETVLTVEPITRNRLRWFHVRWFS